MAFSLNLSDKCPCVNSRVFKLNKAHLSVAVLQEVDFSSQLPHNAAVTDGSFFCGGRVLLEREVLLAPEVPLV